jgi:hypothetical protein
MKREYDFSKGVRGKSSRKEADLGLAIYLDFKLQEQVERLGVCRKNNLLHLKSTTYGDRALCKLLILRSRIHFSDRLLARKNGKDVGETVNQLLRKEVELIDELK